MKAVKLLMSAILALAALAGLTLILNGDPAPAVVGAAPVHAEEVDTAPVGARLMQQHTLSPPYLSDDDVVDAPYDNPPAPTVDGVIAPGEYAGAGKVTFPGYGGHYHDVEGFFKHDGKMVYVAVELPDKVNTLAYVSLLVDTRKVSGTMPMTDDFEFRIRRDGTAQEYYGDGSGWQQQLTPLTWTYGLTETMSGWSVEFGIPFTKLSINAGTFKALGLALENWLVGGPYYYWPTGALSGDPTTWGTLVSSSGSASIVPYGWDTFYWKPGPWEDYAPSGMPDFDQRQENWFLPGGVMGQIWTHDGPASVANSLWWFDSKFESEPHSPAIITDHYRLVTAYGNWDDHNYSNTVPLIDDLAWHFNTNGLQNGAQITGTHPFSMFHGIHDYLRTHGLWDDYIVTMVMSPTFEWVTDEVMRSEDVILLMGIYEDQDPGPDENWVRVGGHYVNVAGVDPMNRQIALSDPLMDAVEQGWRPGRVLSGTLLPHIPIPGHPVTAHNDAGNVSHDVYTVTMTTSPGGIWGPDKYGYVWDPDGGIWIPMWEAFLWIFGANPHPYLDMETRMGTENIQTEVEFAIAVSPYTWKASGEWLAEGNDPVQGAWQPWQDYAPNGVPDFDQKQDAWQNAMRKWSFCGPVAAANSLWWFDTKFEPIPVSPSANNDHYPLVETYDATDPLWDDHDPLNVNDTNTPWPPGGEFIEDLARYFQTDVGKSGTVITDMYTGIEQYITDHELRQGYVITQVKSPEFWWIAEEVEVSEDVILLLGFWQNQGIDEPRWVRLGGHYVTIPGVDKQGGLVAFSDPYYDGAEFAWPLAYPGGWPTVMGRVADGWLTPHPPYYFHGSTVHNDAGNISHDVYHVGPTDSPGGVWGPTGYVEGWDGNFYEQNGDTTGVYSDALSVQAEVDWAVAVSPVADLWIEKQVTPTTVYPGGWVTFTLNYGNWGNLAQNVVISDVLPWPLVNARVVSSQTSYGGPIVSYDTFTWTVGHIPWDGRGMGHGTITVTAQVNPDLDISSDMVVTNTVAITSTTQEQYQLEDRPNSQGVTFTITPPPTWDKWVNSTLWHTGLTVTVETSDTLAVVDVISSSQHFTLRETWNSDHLDLLSATLDPASGGTVATNTNSLKLTAGGWVTLTKLFHIEACTWTQTLLTETLWARKQAWQKPVTINKQAPNLHITATYEPEVFPGQELTFTLHYSNTGGYENDVMVGSVLPTVTTFITSSGGAPDDGGLLPDRRIWWGWNVGDLANGDHGTLVITALVTHTLVPSNTFVISGTLNNHDDSIQKTTVFTLHVSPPQAQWDKRIYVNGVLTSTRPVPVVPSDTVQVVDRVWFTYTKPVTFTLEETWTHSLELTGTADASVGNVVVGTAGVRWSANNVTTNTWHVLTKTFHVTGTAWVFDYLTETLTIAGGPDPHEQIVEFRHKGLCWAVNILSLDDDGPVEVGQGIHFSATVEGDPPITYTWDFGGLGTGSSITGPAPIYTYTNPGTYTVTLDIANACPATDTHILTVTVNPQPNATWDKQIWISGQGPYSANDSPFRNLLMTDTITVTDRVWVTQTGAITFTLEETWSDSLTLTYAISNGGHLTQSPGGSTVWTIKSGTAYTWYILTKTFAVVPGTWTVDGLTETLNVVGLASQPGDVTLQFYHAGVCVPVAIDKLQSDSPVELGQPMHFTASVTGDTPITYTWDFGGAGVQSGTDITPTFIYDTSGTYTVTLDVANACPSSDTHAITVTVNPMPTYTLTVRTVGQGSVDLNPAGGVYTDGTTVELIANAASGWVFDHWSGALTGDTNPEHLTVDADKIVTATFTATTLPTYTLSVHTLGNGSVEKAPSQTTYVSGTVVRLTAKVNPGWYFVTWQGDVTIANNPLNLTMDQDKTVTAVFSTTAPPSYTLKLHTVGQGTVTKSPSATTYLSGTSVQLTAHPASGWIFDEWQGDIQDSTNPDTILMTHDKVVTATFIPAPPTYTLAIYTVGQGTVTKTPSQTHYVSGTTVQLTATPDPGWYFVTWRGDVTIANNPVDVTMDRDKVAIAVFSTAPPPTYTLALHTVGRGTVNKFPSQTNYISGTLIQLTAVPDTGWIFDMWSDDLTGNTNPDTILMTCDKTVTATFTPAPPTYTLSIHVVGNGEATQSPSQTHYISGTIVQLTATPDPGWHFVTWGGDVSIANNPLDLTMNSDKVIIAVFSTTPPPTYRLTAGTVGQGDITKFPSQTDYVSGTLVQLTAVPNAGWQFDMWEGDLTGNTNPDTILMTRDKIVTATFFEIGACIPVTNASFSTIPQANLKTNTPITFTGQVIQGDPPITWHWAFGDGELGNAQTVTHTYTLSDTYTVAMTATNCGGTGVAAATQEITVLKAPSKLYLPLILRNAGTP